MKIDLINATLIDGRGGEPLANAHVEVTGNRISAVNTDDPGPPRNGNVVIDLEGGYLLPGLWDCHVHLAMVFPQGNLQKHPMFEPQASRTLRAGRNAMDALRVGITAMRVVGDPDHLDIRWKQAFASGEFVGPRLFVSGKGLRPTAGHGYAGGTGLEVDGADEFLRAARDQIKHGADWVKIMVTGGVASKRETMHEPQATFEEIAAVVQAARERGKRSAAHIGGPEGAKYAVEAGIDTVEHGYLLDDEVIALMVERGTYLVPTLSVTQDDEYISNNWTPWAIKKARDAAPGHLASFQKAVKAGVKIANGTDLTPIAETTPGEIEQLVRAGLSEMEAIIASTRTAAELCGVEDELGTIEPGKLADMIVVRENPLDDISHLRGIRLVMKDGQIVDANLPANGANSQ
jgi:imidazolonepropionase-like amidohydrolase